MRSQSKAKLAPLSDSDEPLTFGSEDAECFMLDGAAPEAADPAKPRNHGAGARVPGGAEQDASLTISSETSPPMTDRARRYADELKRFYEDLRSADSTELDKQLEKVERDLLREYGSCRRASQPAKKLLN